MKEKFWYLIKLTKNGKTKIIHNTRDAEEISYYPGGRCSMIGIPYKTKDELIKKEKILKNPCKKCGCVVRASGHDAEKVTKNNLCSNCNFWNDRILELKNNKRIVICNGVYYSIGNETSDENKFKGHGGRLFSFKKIDTDEVIESTNVWCGGDIPDVYSKDLKDTAILLPFIQFKPKIKF